MPSLAAVFAHPDDETFSIAGTVSALSRAGVACSLFCATDGDAGRASAVAVASREELGRRRRAELLEAARILGFDPVVTAGYPDGRLAAVDQDELVGRVVRFLRERRPDVVVTFGPEGAPNRHSDHRAISRAATAAYFLAGLPTAYPEQLGAGDGGGLATHAPARLFYVTWPPPAPGDPGPFGLPPAVRVDVRGALETKRAAFTAHRTQHDHRAEFERVGLRPEEWFALASGVAVPAGRDGTLFAGL
ncbi:MAG: PIG-L deacetylase family protein [Gemmatimonadaceae bacterium]